MSTHPNEKLRDNILIYINERPGGAGISIAAKSPTESAGEPTSTSITLQTSEKPPETETIETVSYQTGWIGGGASQASSCARGLAKLQPGYPERKLVLVSSSERSKKDILGKVEYNYFCEFKVVDQ